MRNPASNIPALTFATLVLAAITIFEFKEQIVAALPWQTNTTEETDTAGVTNASSNAEFSFMELARPRPLPELNFYNGGGRATDFTQFHGKLILLNIWATWCLPCREEMPALDRLQARLGGVDFEVVALSIDQAGLKVIREFYDEMKLTHLSIFVDPSMSINPKLSIVGIPTTLLINPAGEEIGRIVGPVEWDSPAVIKTIQQHFPTEKKPG